jgi:predicted nucleotidyltransferase
MSSVKIRHYELEMAASIVKEFVEKHSELDIRFALIVGGLAKGYGTNQDDIDVFVVADRVSAEARIDLLNHLVRMHTLLKYTLDREEPFEFVTTQTVCEKLYFSGMFELLPRVVSYFAYEAVVWCDILSGGKYVCAESDGLLETLEENSKVVIDKWRQSLLTFPGFDVSNSDLDFALLCEKYVSYEKKGANQIEQAVLLGDIESWPAVR